MIPAAGRATLVQVTRAGGAGPHHAARRTPMGAVFKKVTTAWRLAGRRVPAGTPGAEKVSVRSRKWYGSAGGRHVPLCRDKRAAEQMLARLEADAALAGVGIADPAGRHRTRPLAGHLADYAAHLRAKGDTDAHVRLTTGRVAALLAGCGFDVIGDVDAGRAGAWLSALRRPAAATVALPPGVAEFTPAQVAALLGISPAGLRAAVTRHGLAATGHGRARRLPRATVEALAGRAAAGRGPETVNHYVRAARGFFRWMVRARRAGANPLDTLGLLNARVEVRRGRRELTLDELRGLLAAARASARAFRGLSGDDRFHLYLTAAATGFRARALSHLTPPDFRLDGPAPAVTLAARFNKSRKPKVQPVPPDVVGPLKAYLAGKPAGQPVWGGTWARDKRGAQMMRGDLAAAGIPYAVPGPDGPVYADFHALRHSYLTLGGRAGIDLRTLQELAGHSTPELTARYSHRRLADLSGAVGKFPSLVGAAPGGGGPGAGAVCTGFARTGFVPGQPVSAGGDPTPAGGGGLAGVETTEPPVSQGFSHAESPGGDSCQERGRRDSNPQPPDRQSGTLTN
jgi:integrase